MKILNRKTRRAIRKSVGKVVKKHGPQILAGLAGGISSTLATLASTDASTRERSPLSKLSQRVSNLLTGENGRKSERPRGLNKETVKNKRNGVRKRGSRIEQSELA